MLLLNTLDLFCIQVGKCIWQELDVAIHVYIHIWGPKAKKSSQRPGCFGHITHSCRQSKLTLKMQPRLHIKMC